MSLIHLEAINFRNLENISLDFKQHNLFYGANGSGKTSILESIYYLTLGRSFRTHLLSRIVKYETDKFSIFGQIQNNPTILPIPIGIERSNNGSTKIRIAGENKQSFAQLAELQPLQLLNQNSFNLLIGGPKNRRKFIDWGLFHVEQLFFPLWKDVNRILLQRNAAIRQDISYDCLKLWHSELSEYATILNTFREEYITALLPVINELLPQTLGNFKISINYYAGWDLKRNLADILNENIQSDKKAGFAHAGPQRADLKFLINNIPAQDVLSRGQQKLFIFVLQIAQSILLQKQCGKKCIFIIDDFTSELDLEKRKLIVNLLTETQSQIFLAFLTKDDLNELFATNNEKIKMFHVEQGNIGIHSKPSILV